MANTKFCELYSATRDWVDGFKTIELEDVENDLDYSEDIVEYFGSVDDDFELNVYPTLWQFTDKADTDWLNNGRNSINKLKQCGFVVLNSSKRGPLFGINGYGYDFMRNHFMPLYAARNNISLCS